MYNNFAFIKGVFMPSGSHGGGGGSHGGGFGGGSHFGGGHRSSGSSRRGPTPLRIWFFGHRYYVPAEKTSALRGLFTAFFVLILFGFMSTLGLIAAKDQVKKIEDDNAYYINMINYATTHPDYQITGKITGKFRNDDCGKWYLTYSIETANGGTLEGYTYSVYSINEIDQFVVGDNILLAVDSIPVTMRTDSINMDYINIPLENDGEYVGAKNSKRTAMIMTIACFGASVVVAVLTFIKAKKSMKLNELEKEKASSPAQNESVKRCKYCGSKQNPDDTKCPNCGASFVD